MARSALHVTSIARAAELKIKESKGRWGLEPSQEAIRTIGAGGNGARGRWPAQAGRDVAGFRTTGAREPGRCAEGLDIGMKEVGNSNDTKIFGLKTVLPLRAGQSHVSIWFEGDTKGPF